MNKIKWHLRDPKNLQQFYTTFKELYDEGEFEELTGLVLERFKKLGDKSAFNIVFTYLKEYPADSQFHPTEKIAQAMSEIQLFLGA